MTAVAEHYKYYVIVTKQEQLLGVFVGKMDDPILQDLPSKIVAVANEFPELNLPEKLVLHGWYTDKDRETVVQEIKMWINVREDVN